MSGQRLRRCDSRLKSNHWVCWSWRIYKVTWLKVAELDMLVEDLGDELDDGVLVVGRGADLGVGHG